MEGLILVKKYISQDRLKKAFEELFQFFQKSVYNFPENIKEEILEYENNQVLLSRHYEALCKKELLGTGNEEEIEKSKNRMAKQLLDICDRINEIIQKNKIEPQRNNLNSIFPFPAYAGFKELGNSDYNSYSEIANFQVRGDSMQPTVKDGDYLECEKVNNNEVLNGNMYVVSLFNGESNVVKRVYVNKERKIFILKSDNEKYPDREIQEKGVSFWLVKKIKQK
jgi:hypothetical protein